MKIKKPEIINVLQTIGALKMNKKQESEFRDACANNGHETIYINISDKIPFRRCLCGEKKEPI